jgi:hypothetical protein
MGRFATVATSLLAINWEPEIRGVLIVVIAVSLFCGSIYLLLATNLGARLGFLVALTGLMGWMTLMGIMWSIYGIGLKGPDPSWSAVPGRTVLQDTDALFQAGVFEARVDIPHGAGFPEEADLVAEEFQQEGWTQLSEDDPSFSQAAAAAGVFLEDSGAFAAGEYQAQRVFDVGGERYPMIGDFDLFAFFHKPRYAVVEVAPLVPVRTEPGRAPPPATVDDTRQRQYVYMIRDLGARRQPAFVLAFGAGLIFLTGCWLLHRRDRLLTENRSREVVPVGSS